MTHENSVWAGHSATADVNEDSDVAGYSAAAIVDERSCKFNHRIAQGVKLWSRTRLPKFL